MNPLGTGDPLRLGPYRMIGVLGAGGMGKVYLGRDNQGKPAAIKVLRPELAHDPGLAQRFVREAHAAQAVQSKGVARVLGAQTEGGRPWIATEFLAGPTLDGAVERHGPFEDSAVRALGAALARTLRDVHAAGLVHRDVKPANIVLTSSGPRIIDFGIARPEHGLTLTSTGEVPVTPGYGPPEQVLGRRVGPAADVFALGAVLAYAATGVRVFDGGHVAAVQYEVVHGEPRLERLTPELRAVFAPCLAKAPELRPTPEQLAGACAPPARADRAWKRGELAADIAEREREAARLTALPTADTRGGDGGSGGGPSRRRLLTGIAAGGAVLAAGGGAAGWLLTDDDDGHSWDAKPLTKYEPGSAPKPLWGPLDVASRKAPAPTPVRDVILVAADGGGMQAFDVRSGKRRWRTERIAGRGGALASGDDEGTVLGLGASGALVALSAHDGRRQWQYEKADAGGLLAVDEEAVYVATPKGGLRAIALDSHRPRWSVRSPVGASTAGSVKAVASEGHVVVYGTDGAVAVLDAASGKTVWGPKKPALGAHPTGLVPAVADGVLYVGGRKLTAIGLADGHVKWSKSASSRTGWGSPALDGEVLYAVDGPDLKARRTRDGSNDWTLSLSGPRLPRGVVPVVQAHTVWLAFDDFGEPSLIAVDTRKGEKAWSYSQGGAGDFRIAGAGNRVFLVQGGMLTAMPVV